MYHHNFKTIVSVSCVITNQSCWNWLVGEELEDANYLFNTYIWRSELKKICLALCLKWQRQRRTCWEDYQCTEVWINLLMVIMLSKQVRTWTAMDRNMGPQVARFQRNPPAVRNIEDGFVYLLNEDFKLVKSKIAKSALAWTCAALACCTRVYESGFTLGFKTKITSKLRDPIGRAKLWNQGVYTGSK